MALVRLRAAIGSMVLIGALCAQPHSSSALLPALERRVDFLRALGVACAQVGLFDLAALAWSQELYLLADLHQPLQMRAQAERYVAYAVGRCQELSLARLRAPLGQALRATGDLLAGERASLSALAVARAEQDDFLRARCAMDAAWAASQSGRPQEMVPLCREAEAAALRCGDYERAHRARNATAWGLGMLGEIDEARALYRSSQEGAHRAQRHDLCFESAVRAAELEQGLLRDEGQNPRAERALERMQRAYAEIEETVLLAQPHLVARRLRCLANYHGLCAGGRLPTQLVQELENLLAGPILPSDHASLLYSLAIHYLVSDELELARDLALRLIASSQPIGLTVWVARGGLILGQITALQGESGAAIARIAAEFATLESLPARDIDVEGWIQRGRSVNQIASQVIATLYRAQLEHPAPALARFALELYDRGRAVTLRERPGLGVDLAAQSTSILSSLAPDTLLLAFDTQAALLFAACAGEIKLIPLPSEANLRRRIDFCRTALLDYHDASEYARLASALARDVLGPVASWLADASTMIVVPSGPLYALPLDLWLEPALRPKPELGLRGLPYLFLRRTVFHAPLVQPLPKTDRGHGQAGKILLWAPVSRDLPESQAEVGSVEHIWAGRELLSYVGEEATESALLAQNGSQVRGLHISGHVDRVPGTRNLGLVCAPSRGSDSRADLRELTRLKLEAEWVVLAVCDGGSGFRAQSEGLMTLGWAFLYGGAQSVLLAPAPVPDGPTRALVEAYHRELARGLEPTTALHAARCALWDERSVRGLEAALLPFYSLCQSW